MNFNKVNNSKLTNSKHGGGASLNNNNASSKRYAIIFGILAIVIVTTGASFAFFNYSKIGNTTNTITSGDIEFTFKDVESANLENAFPVSDTIGANDETEEYTFTVNLKSSSSNNKMNYNVWLLDNNKEAQGVSYFTNDQIKFALIKDGTFVAGTSGNLGKKLTDISGFTTGKTIGEGIVLENQEILSGKTDEYKLRIWISDDVNYSNTVNGQDEQTSTGKYNGYKYSLKVKVTSGMASSTEIGTVSLNKLTFTTTIEDENGLDSYAVTTTPSAPEDDSSEWISVSGTTSKSGIIRTNSVVSKTIEYMVKKNGVHYLHVKNKLNQVKSKSFTANAVGENAVDKIVGLAATNTNELRIDEHEPTGQQTFPTKEYRYYGKTPNNYVWFNNELWRIIGAMDVDDGSNPDGTGNVDKRLKIIRANPIGNYSWDSSDLNTNLGYGVNEWTQADLMTLLNSGAYYNRTTGECYNAKENGTTPCNFSENSTTPGLTSEAKEMIGNAKWYLGAGPEMYSSLTSVDFYGYERGTDSGKQCTQDNNYCSDSVTRKTYWTGQIGLMYPSDYGYSTNMNSCSSTALKSYSTSCKDTTWLYNNISHQWTLSSRPLSSHAADVFDVLSNGSLDIFSAYSARAIFPSTYLTSDIKILDGEGTTERPFVLSK